jgi:putative transposase
LAAQEGVQVAEVGARLTASETSFGVCWSTTILIEHGDRLAWFGVEYVAAALVSQGRRIVAVEEGETTDDLIRDKGSSGVIVHQAYRFALDPTPRQQGALASHVGGARFAYNWGLELVKRRLDERAAGQDVAVPWTLPALRREWNRAKATVAPWWADNSKEAYSSGLDALARGLRNWADAKQGRRAGAQVGFPRRKRKGHSRSACRFSTGAIRTEADRHHVTLPRLGCLKTHESTRKLSRRLEQGTARILAATISQHAGRWSVSFTCQVQRAQRRPRRPAASIGVDVGIMHLAVLSSGEQVANPRPLAAALRRLRPLNRQLARQQGPRGPDGTVRAPSAGWRKTQRELARRHARVANLRAEALHQLTTGLAAEYGTVVVERLNVAGMVRNRRLARAIADSGMGQVRRLLGYKCSWAGGRLVEAGTYFASSKTCSDCGTVKAKLLLAERTFRCPACGLVVDRDLNAARNLAALVDGIQQIEQVVAGSGPETERNACERDCQPIGTGGRSGNPDIGREAAGSQQSIRM